MAVEGHYDVIHRHAQFLRRRADDPQVCLMRHQPVQRRTFKIIRGQRLINDVR